MLADLGHSAASDAVAAAPVVQPPEEIIGTLGDFRILRDVGRGGTGVSNSSWRRWMARANSFSAAFVERFIKRPISS
jgi:hypothetical protein